MAEAMRTGSFAWAIAVFMEHAVTTELHRNGRVARGSNAGVDDDGDLRVLENDAQIMGVSDPKAAADRRRERHHRCASRALRACDR